MSTKMSDIHNNCEQVLQERRSVPRQMELVSDTDEEAVETISTQELLQDAIFAECRTAEITRIAVKMPGRER
ncbi:MAG: hypothetical protein HY914_15495 [Desulfomonile tiedjei]|nr:hypothetical protein [Desulfomonile tiedjei]